MEFIKPDLTSEKIFIYLQDTYGVDAKSIAFLPIGADFNTAVYRVTTRKKSDYFLKLRRGSFFEASVSVPKYLAELGVTQVIPPIATKTGQLWANLDLSMTPYKVMLYPYIEGHNGVQSKLSEDQWATFGATIKKLHSTDISLSIINTVPRETFSSTWRECVKAFLMRSQNEIFKESVIAETASFLKSKNLEILKMIDDTEQLATGLQKQSLEQLLCHADMHGWNLLIDNHNSLYIVDWDTLILAPKERDLMFIGAGIWDSGRIHTEEESLFYTGYGKTEINQDAICYYRLERIIQDIGEFCKHIFLSGTDDTDRIQSFKYLHSNFLPNGTIERAYQSNRTKTDV